MSLARKLVMLWGRVGTFWNPADKAGDITLSGGALVMQRTAYTEGPWVSARSTSSRLSGKLYFEVTVSWSVLPGQLYVGICSSSFPLADGHPPGQSTSAAYNTDTSGTSNLLINGVSVCDADLLSTSGDVAAVAIDFTHGKMWVKKAVGGLWNGDGANNPATNVGGQTFTGVVPGAAYIFGTIAGAADHLDSVLTLNIGGSGFAGTIPSGFSPWG